MRDLLRRSGMLLLLFTLAVIATKAAVADGLRPEAPSTVQDTLNKRCVVCHGCYDAPCQLKLSSRRGWLRGASKTRVYESSRLEDAPPTRLGIDAKTAAQWRRKGFFAVTGPGQKPSVVEQLLRAGRENRFNLGAALPDSIDIGPLRKNSCPAPSEMDRHLAQHPMGGMPFATAPLPKADFERLMEWAVSGGEETDAPREPSTAARTQIAAIETFFNSKDMRGKLVSRYIYEHLFLAHLHLEGDTTDSFFRLIRSRTAPGAPPDEIPTRRPFDDPGGPFFYRLIPLDGTVLHKEHVVYQIGQKRLSRYADLFFSSDWTLKGLPPYSQNAGGNPLSTFSAMPARSRYQFLLDDALYFVRSFIRGPVCYGQVAVNVIEDRFWVAFLAPGSDLSVTDPSFLKQATPILELPVASSQSKITERLKQFLQNGPVRYQAFRQSQYARKTARDGGPDYRDIWDGDGSNKTARLTVFRNFSSASVVEGFHGSVPETAWVIDFPLFERIYYNLVAGFDVFGNVEHQLATRIYMDNLRREGERTFLSFLPADMRRATHEGWYRGPLVELVNLWKESAIDTRTPTAIVFETQDPKAEFLTRLLTIEPALWAVSDPINRCEGSACADPSSIAGHLRSLSASPAPFAKYLPDVAVLIVETGDGDEIYTLVHDKAHSNVAFIFNEDLRREPADDSLTIVPGQFSSYPNFVFRVEEADIGDFVTSVSRIRSRGDYLETVNRFGIRRTHRDFWAIYDRLQAGLNAQDPLEGGLLDLNRYRDPKPSDPLDRLLEFTFSVD